MSGIFQKFTAFFVILTVLTAGCGKFAPATDSAYDRNPDYLHARKAVEAGDFRVAAAFYGKALRAAPEAAKLHLELGLLYDEKLSDPITAIYHYRQFLELEPNSERKQVVESFIERAKLTLTAKLPSSSVDSSELVRLQTEKSALMQENAGLRLRVTELERVANAGTTVPVPVPGPDTPPASDTARTVIVTQAVVATGNPPPAVPRLHVVQKGDTLQSIALRYYGTRSGWDKIFAANRANMPGPGQLKIGQQLVIP